MFNLKEIPIIPQRQDSLKDQLSDLIVVANRMGMHDAADAIKQIHQTQENIKYGCHCDLDYGMKPDDCVIDDNDFSACLNAKEGMRKEQCEYWKIIV